MVSVLCNTYNHERYIKDALNGFIMQKTNFKFEVLIHDDASTDKTADIIREYEAKYPDIIKPIYQTENQFSKKVKILRTYQYPRAKGKYIAMCEGDDCWIDENKLQKQVDFLEANPNCVMTCHNSIKINHQTGEQKVENPIEKRGYATAYDIITDKPRLWIATASLVFEKRLLDTYPEFFRTLPVGDMPLRWYCFAMGDVYYFEDVMSVYNYKVPGSWSASRSGQTKNLEKYLEFYDKYNEFTDYKYADYVNDEALKRKFYHYVSNCDVKEITKKEYAHLYKKLPFKEKVYIRLYRYIPFVLKAYSSMKARIKSIR